MAIDWVNLHGFIRLILILSSSFNPGGCPHVLRYICDFQTPTDSKISGLFGDISISATSHIICLITKYIEQLLAMSLFDELGVSIIVTGKLVDGFNPAKYSCQ